MSAGLRPWLVWAHRYVGLVMAGFLLLAGLTGALLVWYHELDAALNPQLMRVQAPVAADGAPLPPLSRLALREHVQAALPQAWVHWVPLQPTEPHQALSFWVEGAADAQGQHADLGFDEVFVNPYTGQILGTRQWGDITQGMTNLMPFIYRLHYSLALGAVGTWVFGIVALLWTIDCFVGAWLTMPVAPRSGRAPAKSWWARWAPAWKLRWRSGTTKLNFDLHRAGGLWPWAMLFVLAWSSVAFNLYEPVYRPVMGALFNMQPDVRSTLPAVPQPQAHPPMGWATSVQAARQHAQAQAQKQGWQMVAPDRVSYNPEKAYVRYVVRSDRDVNERRGQTSIVIDARDGTLLAVSLPTGAASGDTVTSWLLSLHMGHVWGLPYRVFLTLLGVAVAVLSVTGVIIWWKKRRGRSHLPQGV